VRFLEGLRPVALLTMRLVLGIIMVAHGCPKVFGGFARHQAIVSGFGFPAWAAYLSTTTEFLGGMLIVAGLLTRFFSLAMILNMTVAIWKVHWSYGLTADRGYELNLALISLSFGLLVFGGGPISLDRLIWGRRKGPAARKG
jgi:putative oxidoreductase